MMVFSAQLAEGEDASPFPILFHSIYPIHPLSNKKAVKASVASTTISPLCPLASTLS
jgi:hypothetical protein